MILLSWQVTVIALVLIPAFIFPARWVGRKLQRLTRESMQLDAADGLDDDRALQRGRGDAGEAVRPAYRGDRHLRWPGRSGPRHRGDHGDVRVGAVISLTLLASLATAVVYGLGGVLVIDNIFKIGTLVALAA